MSEGPFTKSQLNYLNARLKTHKGINMQISSMKRLMDNMRVFMRLQKNEIKSLNKRIDNLMKIRGR